MRSKLFVFVPALAAGLVFGCGSSSASAQPAPPQPTAIGRVVVQAVTTLNGQLVVNMDGKHPGITIIGSQQGLQQPFQVFDWLKQPIFQVNSDGGASVSGDDFSVFGGGDVFNPTVRLYQGGAIQFGGKGGPTLYAGKADPNITPPQHDVLFQEGDRYYWNNRAYLYPIMVYNGLFWIDPLHPPVG